MARGKWTIKSYNAYLSAAKSSYGLSHRQAQAMYRSHAERAGGPLNSRSLRDHPRIARQEAQRAAEGPKRGISRGGAGEGAGGAGAGAGPGVGPGRVPQVPEEFEGIEDWMSDGYEADEEDEY